MNPAPKRLNLLTASSSMDGGGSERQMLQLLETIDRSAFQSQLYLFYRSGPLLSLVPGDIPVHSFSNNGYGDQIVANPADSDREVHRSQLKENWWRRWLNRLPRRINLPGTAHRQQIAQVVSLINQHSIDVVYDRLFHMTLVTGRAIMRNRNRSVAHVTTLVSPPSQDVPRCEKRYLRIKRFHLSRIYRRATIVLAVSNATADDAAEYYELERNKIRIVPSPINAARIDQLASAPVENSIEAPGFSADSIFEIVCVGRLSSEKGQRYLIEAMPLLNRLVTQSSRPAQPSTPVSSSSAIATRLTFVGDGPMRNELAQLVQRLGLEGQIRFVGHVDNPYSYIRNADIVCIPSVYEGFPNVLMESVLCETETVVTNCSGSVGPFLKSAKLNAPVATKDPEALASALQKAILSPSSLERLKSASQFVRSTRDLKCWVRQMEDVFREAVELKQRHQSNSLRTHQVAQAKGE